MQKLSRRDVRTYPTSHPYLTHVAQEPSPGSDSMKFGHHKSFSSGRRLTAMVLVEPQICGLLGTSNVV